ncbi:hypothetical protein VN97_g9689 [Penicillium thymicola]|uniref:Uncharacterized protein n=1 Tax=Penicillium thymicola TaxID=293382 RepID=A0AAI9TAE1_PENTH|nr:hypothetical protein VN97_g9689 [Penicillium thymicola]
MKTMSISSLVLATATSILAAPSPVVPALGPLQLTDLNAAIYSSSPPTTCLLSFALKDPNTNTDTKCSAYWSIGMPGNKTYDCSDKAYQLHLPNGIYDIENFDLGVSRADGTESGRSVVSGDLWKCEKQEYPKAQCKWDVVGSKWIQRRFAPEAISIRLVDTCKEYYDITLWTRLLAHEAQKGEALAIYVDTERSAVIKTNQPARIVILQDYHVLSPSLHPNIGKVPDKSLPTPKLGFGN